MQKYLHFFFRSKKMQYKMFEFVIISIIVFPLEVVQSFTIDGKKSAIKWPAFSYRVLQKKSNIARLLFYEHQVYVIQVYIYIRLGQARCCLRTARAGIPSSDARTWCNVLLCMVLPLLTTIGVLQRNFSVNSEYFKSLSKIR